MFSKLSCEVDFGLPGVAIGTMNFMVVGKLCFNQYDVKGGLR